MPSTVDSVNQSLYFAATAAASQQAAKQAKKTDKSGRATRASFANSMQKSQEEFMLASEGLPPEIAGMDMESAVVFLKDEMDIAGEQLTKLQSMENIETYRKKVGQFMKYLVKNNFEVLKHKKGWKSRKTGKADPYIQVQVINQKLNQLASDMLYNHSKNLKILARIEEINGLIVDLLAA